MNINEIKARHAAATPGPWFAKYGDDSNFMQMCCVSTVKDTPAVFPNTTNYIHDPATTVAVTLLQNNAADISDTKWDENTEFIAHSWEDIKYLIDLVTSLQRPTITVGDWILSIDSTGDKHHYGWAEKVSYEHDTALIVQVSGNKRVVKLSDCQKVPR